MIFISALTGQRVTKLFAIIHEVAEAHARRIPTGKLNEFLRDTVARMSPPAVDGKLPKLFFMTQVGTRPPSFVIKTNTDRDLHFSYQRYLENQLREAFGFTGTPIRFAFRKRGKGEGEDDGVAKVRRILDPGEGLKPSRQKEAPATRSGAQARRRETSARRTESTEPLKDKTAPVRRKAAPAVPAEAPARPREPSAPHPVRPKQPKRAVTRPRGKTGPRKGTAPRSGKATARPVRAPRKRST
jgi:GTP-binding protein